MSTSTGQSVSANVDSRQCALTGMCKRIAPQVFDLPDDSDVAVVIKDPVTDPTEIALVEEAEQACPTMAISLSH